MSRFSEDLLFILVTLIGTAVIFFFAGWLLRGLKSKRETTIYDDKEINKLKSRIVDLENELQNCKKQITDTTVISESGEIYEASKIFERPIYKDDLTIVEGIGPKIQEILKTHNHSTWEDISKSSKEKIEKILLGVGGSEYQIHDATTWAEQARLAVNNKWKELKKYQDFLLGGRIVS